MSSLDDSSSDPSRRPLTLGDDLTELGRLAEQGPVTFGAMVDALQDRASTSLLVILSFAFVFVPIPGVSTASSVLFLALAATSVLGTKLYLPGWIRRRSMSQTNAQRALKIAGSGWARAERVVRPRLTFLTYGPFRWLAGLSLVAAIVAFALPIPIPFNNSPPAFCILLLSLGLLGRDGLFVLLGHVANLVMWLLLYLAGNMIVDAIRALTEKFGWTTPVEVIVPATQQAMLHHWAVSIGQCLGIV